MTTKPSLSLSRLFLVPLVSTMGAGSLSAEEAAFVFDDPDPQRYTLRERASAIDPRVRAYPEIDFLIETEEGKPADHQDAAVDTSVVPRGELVIWMMGSNEELFSRLNSYGLHVIRPHYANKWFSLVCRERPVGPTCRGDVRLEAATGEDFSEHVEIHQPDGMMERSYRFVKWLSQENPQGGWAHFLDEAAGTLRWDRVVMAGSSHGSTTSARFAKHVEVARVVMLCGPRDQYQTWQSLPSATPANRYFGFSHVLDGGWVGDHYCRSWELLGLHAFGPIVNVDETPPPYGDSRRLVTDADVDGNADHAHGAVTPGRRAVKDEDGSYLHEAVWRYLFTHPVDAVGEAVPMDPDCLKEHPQ